MYVLTDDKESRNYREQNENKDLVGVQYIPRLLFTFFLGTVIT